MFDAGGCGVRVLALMDTVPSVKLETFGQWGAQVNTAKYTNLCFTRSRLDLLLIAGILIHSVGGGSQSQKNTNMSK